jgi:hypothetical protein
MGYVTLNEGSIIDAPVDSIKKYCVPQVFHAYAE